ncbi:hypothetical protein HGRIS_008503 [Hohenbuehelia grisea]|uniref:EF-hand domain-containing protein n=1 Tax=Hohenbuehelia grisea TaxID=104357 RepID=A0ABR3J8L0_9AGAR
MKDLIIRWSLFALVPSVLAHGGHEGPKDGETIQQYAQRHMSSEHHIDSFDVRSFFQLHDLDRNGVWDKEEIEAVYGVHHIYSQKKSKDDIEHQRKADHIVDAVLQKLDANKDGVISPEELEEAGLDALPNFESIGAEGHHYDVESEFFLHHEEKYHSTPETQTDESYNHAEDLEHFAMHEEIERKEAEREAKYQGLSVDEVLKSHEHDGEKKPSAPDADAPAPADPAAVPDHPEHPHNDQAAPEPGAPAEPPKVQVPKVTRVTPPEKQDPSVRFKDAGREGSQKPEWGTGDEGYRAPKNPADRLRKNAPYKYKFRRNWGDF